MAKNMPINAAPVAHTAVSTVSLLNAETACASARSAFCGMLTVSDFVLSDCSGFTAAIWFSRSGAAGTFLASLIAGV